MSRAPRKPHATTSRALRNQHAARKTLQPTNRPSSISHHPTRAKAHQPRELSTFARRGETLVGAFAVILNSRAVTPNQCVVTLSPRVVILSAAKDLSSLLASFAHPPPPANKPARRRQVLHKTPDVHSRAPFVKYQEYRAPETERTNPCRKFVF